MKRRTHTPVDVVEYPYFGATVPSGMGVECHECWLRTAREHPWPCKGARRRARWCGFRRGWWSAFGHTVDHLPDCPNRPRDPVEEWLG